MTLWSITRAVVVCLALAAGLLFAAGTLRPRKRGDTAVFVAGWTLALISALVIVQHY